MIKCEICGKVIDNIEQHVLIKHGITYNNYCEEYLNIPSNYKYILNLDVTTAILKYCDKQYIQNKKIKEYFQKVAIENKYLFNQLYKLFNQYTLIIYKYLQIDINTDNIDKYELITLPINENYQEALTHIQVFERRRRQYDSSVKPVQCKICGSNCNEHNLLIHVGVAHKMSKKDYLTTYYGIPDTMDFSKLTLKLVFKMFEELEKSSYDNFRDCYQALYDQVHNYDELDQKLGYKAHLICNGLNLVIHTKWSEERKKKQSSLKTGKKWTPLQRQRILESKNIINNKAI